ncbi:MAG: LysR family transcriptional regulator [Pseudolabrys sp.]
MEMHQVRYFLAVADELNFTRAAEKCNVSQPSLSRAIKCSSSNSAAIFFGGSTVTRIYRILAK